MIIKTFSPEETIEIGKKIGKLLKLGDFIAYSGDLGAGKTTLTRGILQGLGQADEVTSPTFSIVNEYDSDIPVYHFDMYRIENADELEFTGFYDYPLEESIFIVEWSENISSAIPENAIEISMKYLGDTEREIEIKGDERFENSWD